jgi:HNH endonuclease
LNQKACHHLGRTSFDADVSVLDLEFISRSVPLIEKSATDGELLCNLINHKLLAKAPWEALGAALGPTGRHLDLVDFYRQITAVGLTGRIVAAGTSIEKTLPLDDPAFKKEFASILRDYVGIPSHQMDETYRAAYRAVAASLEPLRNSVKNQMQAFAMRSHSHCYMCGAPLNFDQQMTHASYTCEHVWPRAYGGNSIVENLLPSCNSCNNLKKAHFATWAMPAIQSLILGLSPSTGRLQEIDGSFKFALHYRAAQALAMRQRITLKGAFLQLGPWEDVRVRDENDIVDVFNLENHAADRSVA